MKILRTIDKLGEVKSQIAALQLLEKSLASAIKAEMIKADVREAEGDLFRATFTVTERVSVDSKAVAARFPREVAPELYSSSLVESLRVTARTGERVKEAA
jgi:hypothetical protein